MSSDPVPPRSMRRRFVRLMRVAAALAILIAGVAVAMVARGRSGLHSHILIAIALGIGLAILLGTAVTTLIFLGHRRGDATKTPTAERDEQ